MRSSPLAVRGMDDTSLSLLERLQRNPSESAWRDVVELYSPLLDDWLTRFKLQGADREDLVQESLTTVLQHVGSFRHGGQGSFRAWLRAVVANRVREFWRRRGRHPQATGDSDFAEMLQQLESPESSPWPAMGCRARPVRRAPVAGPHRTAVRAGHVGGVSPRGDRRAETAGGRRGTRLVGQCRLDRQVPSPAAVTAGTEGPDGAVRLSPSQFF